MSDYGALSRLLHRIALGPAVVREASFDLDQAIGRGAGADPAAVERPVFVTGLARSGTSILMRTLYRTGAFATLTYRDMPFVLAPRLWRRVSHRFGRDAEERERAHGDGLTIGFDSPEAFEEVFWLTFAHERYVVADRLVAHDGDDRLIARFRRYVAAILAAARSVDRPPRYLSKNNNNLLRLATLRRAFPEGRIVVPFRRPENHAASLLRQHRRFVDRHRADPFDRRYMRWLGHFEFGADLRPFDLADAAGRLAGHSPDRLDYWLVYWTAVYEWVLGQSAAGAVLFDYDAFCSNPQAALEALLGRLEVTADIPALATGITSGGAYDPPADADTGALARAREVYELLREKAGAATVPT